MDMDKRNAEGISPIKNDLAKIEAIKNLADLQTYLTAAVRTGDNPLYSWYAYTDLKNSKMNTIYLGGPRLGLGRDYYQKRMQRTPKRLTSTKICGFSIRCFRI